MKAFAPIFFLFALILGLVGCGGSGGAILPDSIAITPGNTGVLVNGRVQFTVISQGGNFGDELVWEVLGGSANGTVSSAGLYTAPATIGTYTVRAFFKGSPTVSASTTVTVANSVTLDIAPTTTKERYDFNESVRFGATVKGQNPKDITWSVSPAGIAKIDQTGLLAIGTSYGLIEVVATSNIYPSKRAAFKLLVSEKKVVKLTCAGKGDIYIQMATDVAPNTTKNFMDLSRSGFYDGVFMHRYGPDEGQPNFIQGGDPNTKTLPLSDPSIGTGGPGYQIAFEANSLKHVAGAIAMARSQALDSAGSQFYLCSEDISAFDGNYVVFGQVISGLETVQSLRRGDQILKAVVLE